MIETSLDKSYVYYVSWFVASALVLGVIRLVFGQTQDVGQGKRTEATPKFKTFQNNFVLVYLIMMGADWLQGPYVYALYKHYGYDIQTIGILFVVGFGTSMIVGTVVGSAADVYGRKFVCLAFGAIYGASCIVKHSSDFYFLLAGRFLAGTATSILFSIFETWMVSQHNAAGYTEDLLAQTFSLATSGNGIVAVLNLFAFFSNRLLQVLQLVLCVMHLGLWLLLIFPLFFLLLEQLLSP